MKKFGIAVLFVIFALLSPFIAYAVFNPEKFPAILEELYSDVGDRSKGNCPPGIKLVLDEIRLKPSEEVSCKQSKNIKFEDKKVKVINVSYEYPKTFDRGSWRSVSVLVVSAFNYQALPNWFLSKLNSYVSNELRTPFGDNSGFTTEKFSTARIVKKRGIYCMEFNFSAPFEGNVLQCQRSKNIQEGTIKEELKYKGNIAYQERAFTWEQAMISAQQECIKMYSSECVYYRNKNGDLFSTSSWRDPSKLYAVSVNEGQIEYYVLPIPLYKDGNQRIMLTKVYPDNSVFSKLVVRADYRPEDLLRLAADMNK